LLGALVDPVNDLDEAKRAAHLAYEHHEAEDVEHEKWRHEPDC
jgi:hypothetical protein